jgi:hypothetical protein
MFNIAYIHAGYTLRGGATQVSGADAASASPALAERPLVEWSESVEGAFSPE